MKMVITCQLIKIYLLVNFYVLKLGMCEIVIIALDNVLSLETLIYILVLKKLRGLKIKF